MSAARLPRFDSPDNRIGDFNALTGVETGLKAIEFRGDLLDFLLRFVVLAAGCISCCLP